MVHESHPRLNQSEPLRPGPSRVDQHKYNFHGMEEEGILQTYTSGVVLEGKEEFQWESVMVNFKHQLHWSTGCPGICLNIILGMTMKVILVEINIWISRLNEADCSSQWGWASYNPSKA